MRTIYRVLALVVAGLVVVQAAAIAFAFGGVTHYIMGGGVVDKAVMESHQSTFTGDLGFPVHGLVGGTVIPAVGLALLIISFFARVPRGRACAAVLFGLIALQVMAGYSVPDLPYLGILHGANALAVLLTAVYASRLARRVQVAPAETTTTAHVPV